VINGKFVAGVAAIALAVGTVLAAVAGYGILRLGLVPTGTDLTRLVVFFLVSVVYISLWLAVAILFSTLSRRSSTTILATIALWLVMTFFAGLVSGTIADALHPTTTSSAPEAVLANARLDQDIHRISPDELYEEATQVLLDPAARRRPPADAHSPPPLHEQQATGVLDDRADGHFDPRFLVHWSESVSGLCMTSARAVKPARSKKFFVARWPGSANA
jgi:ABC-2 type transport system permease protein